MTQTARDFLADNGLAIRGARGKFSKEAKAFLAKAQAEGKVFADAKTAGVQATPVRKAVVLGAPVRVRKETMIRVVESDGTTIHIDWCFNCARSVGQCGCKGGPQVSQFLSKNAQGISLV
jgi:hypothetical protein